MAARIVNVKLFIDNEAMSAIVYLQSILARIKLQTWQARFHFLLALRHFVHPISGTNKISVIETALSIVVNVRKNVFRKRRLKVAPRSVEKVNLNKAFQVVVGNFLQNMTRLPKRTIIASTKEPSRESHNCAPNLRKVTPTESFDEKNQQRTTCILLNPILLKHYQP